MEENFASRVLTASARPRLYNSLSVLPPTSLNGRTATECGPVTGGDIFRHGRNIVISAPSTMTAIAAADQIRARFVQGRRWPGMGRSPEIVSTRCSFRVRSSLARSRVEA